MCGQSKDRIELLELEHKIPVFVGGHLFEKENIDLICSKCHGEKTILDKKIIKILKEFKLISYDCQNMFFSNRKIVVYLKFIYFYLKYNLMFNNKKFQKLKVSISFCQID